MTSSPFSLFLALRYLKPKRSFVSVITVISILGVTLGIAVMIIVISVMKGFDTELQQTVLGFEPDITIQSERPIDDWRRIIAGLGKTPGVVAAAPQIEGPVIAEHRHTVATPELVGIDPEAELKVVNIKGLITQGTYNLDDDSVILGETLADSLGVRVGDKITITGPGNLNNILDEIQKEGSDPNTSRKTLADLKNEGIVMPADVTVTGIFESGRYEYDANVLFVPLSLGQELYDMEDAVHSIAVKTDDPYDTAGRVKNELNSTLHEPAFAETWMDRNADRFDAIRIERTVMFFILMFIVIVAAFGIMNTLITVTVQKTRDIGVMKALGATTWQIIWVFMMQGMVVGFFGNLTGLLLGIGIVHYRNQFRAWLSNTFHVAIFPADIYDFSAIPAQIVPHDVAIICISGFVICSLAAFFPAWFAARLDPVEALRYE
ncbi:MAG: ABC transporter permease [Chthoniobacteraceae bacterium]